MKTREELRVRTHSDGDRVAVQLWPQSRASQWTIGFLAIVAMGSVVLLGGLYLVAAPQSAVALTLLLYAGAACVGIFALLLVATLLRLEQPVLVVFSRHELQVGDQVYPRADVVALWVEDGRLHVETEDGVVHVSVVLAGLGQADVQRALRAFERTPEEIAADREAAERLGRELAPVIRSGQRPG